MGTCFTPNSQYINTAINERLKDEKHMVRKKRINVIILLGTKYSGKSTVFHQLQRVRDGKLIEPNDKYLNVIRQECLSTIIYLLSLVKDTASILLLQSITDLKQIASIISTVWIKYNKFQNILSHSYAYKDEFNFNDNIDYFIDNINRIMNDEKNEEYDSILTDEDIINYHTDNSHKEKAQNFYTYQYIHRDNSYQVIDFQTLSKKTYYVSGAPYYHRKSIIYMAALSDYCETLKIKNINAMQYALDEFGIICNYNWLKRFDFILFLNKEDIFMKRIRKGISLSVCFSDKWKGPNFPNYEYNNSIAIVISIWIQKAEIDIGLVIHDLVFKLISEYSNKEVQFIGYDEQEIYFNQCCNKAITFILNQFTIRNKEPHRQIYCHATSAIDKFCVEKVIWDVQNMMSLCPRRNMLI